MEGVLEVPATPAPRSNARWAPRAANWARVSTSRACR